MSKLKHSYVTITREKLETLIKLSKTGYKSRQLKVRKNLSRAKELEWLRDQAWEMDRACWKDGVRHIQGFFGVPGNCFCCRILVGNPSQVRQAKKGTMEYRHHCRRCGRLVCDLCSKQYVKLWVFWDVDTESLKACKKEDAREKMRCCDACIRQLHGAENRVDDVSDEGVSQSVEKEEEEAEKDGEQDLRGKSFYEKDGKKKKRITTLSRPEDGKYARFSQVMDKEKRSNLENKFDHAMHSYVQTFKCWVCEGDFSFLHGWKNSNMRTTDGLTACIPCSIDQNIQVGQKKLYSVFLNDIPPRATNEDLFSLLTEYAREQNRHDFVWKYAYSKISLDANGMPFLSEKGLARALVRLYQADAQQWLLNQKVICINDADHFYGYADEFRLRVSKKPLFVAESGKGFSRWGDIKLTAEVANYAKSIIREKIMLEKIKTKVGRKNRRAYGGSGILRCPGKLGGCSMGTRNRQNGICPECGGLRVTKEQLGGGRHSSYEDAIEAARMNDETRLHGIFSLKSTAVSNNSLGSTVASDPFTAPTVTKQKGSADIVVGKSHRGQTALHVAALSGSFESVKVLLDLNYEVKEQSVDLIAKYGNKPILSLPQDMYGSTPLHLAAMEGHMDIVELFLNRGAQKIMNNNMKRLPLHYAAANGHVEICRLLLQDSPEQLLMEDVLGNSAINLARNSTSNAKKMKELIQFLESNLNSFK